MDAHPPPVRAQAAVLRAAPPLPAPRKPGVVLWYRFWCARLALFHVVFAIQEILVARGKVEPTMGLVEEFAGKADPGLRNRLLAAKRTDAPGLAAFVLVIALFCGFAAAAPCRRWAWTLALVALGATLFPFLVSAAGAVPILVPWARADTKVYHGLRG